MSDGIYKKEWDDKAVYMKGFWCLVLPPPTMPPDWFAQRYLDIKKKYDKKTLEQWSLDAVKSFIDWGKEDDWCLFCGDDIDRNDKDTIKLDGETFAHNGCNASTERISGDQNDNPIGDQQQTKK